MGFKVLLTLHACFELYVWGTYINLYIEIHFFQTAALLIIAVFHKVTCAGHFVRLEELTEVQTYNKLGFGLEALLQPRLLYGSLTECYFSC